MSDINHLTSEKIDETVLRAITSLAQQINCLDIKRIADICVERIPGLIGAGMASLYILDETNGILHLQKHNRSNPINKIVSLNQTPAPLMAAAVKTRELMVIENVDTHRKPVIKKSQRPYAQNYSSNSCIIAPLVCHDRVEGVLNFAGKIGTDQFSNVDIAVVELFRQLIGASVGNIKLFERIQQQAQTDGLTGLLNHRTFYEAFEKELRRTQRYGEQLSLIMADMDNLKQINDKYGHRAGDLAIRQISRQIIECIRTIDTAARYAGDEFAVILPNTPLLDAFIVGKRIVDTVSASPMVWEDEQIVLSISVGVGQYNISNSPEDIIARSDEALYAAKRAGKNRVAVFNESVKLPE
ncbi:MAG: sensor domain-containing diguanylate cyclase [Planctomycetota bacterium]